jgi:choline dehydrogenase-like flavoprotein
VTNVVVGSGPSGVVAALALLERGESVTLVDAGVTIEPEIAARVAALGRCEPDAWPADAAERLGAHVKSPAPLPKLLFGSARPYALDALREVRQDGTECLLSFARGGLSTVWGGAVLPSRAGDLVDWPIGLDDLAPHYAAVGDVLDLAGEHDALEASFPLYAALHPGLPPSPQTRAVLARARRHATALTRRGLCVGAARLAVRSPGDGPRGCRGCGFCLSGCPYGAIWDAGTLVDTLHAHPSFRERSGHVVRRIVASPQGPRVEGVTSDTGAAFAITARRVFLAAGPLSTARIVIDSCRAWQRLFELRYQPYFLLPVLTARDYGEDDGRTHALAQVFLEIDDPAVSAYTAHLQLYTSSQRLRAELRRSLSRWGRLGEIVARQLDRRVGAIQGYLHDRQAGPVTLRASPGRDGGACSLDLHAPEQRPERAVVRRINYRLAAATRSLGIVPLLPLLEIGHPGNGNHLGGIFPMRRTPGLFETDTLGRLRELPGVHIVDASVLPSLPATTFTYTLMANAHRIAHGATNGGASE